MKNHFSKVCVRYGETDQMGVVHHGNYAQYLELARIEWLQKFGVSYKTMEESGVMLPVYEMQFKFKKPAFFGDVLRIETALEDIPKFKIDLRYTIKNQEDQLLTTARTVLVFTDAETRKPRLCPDYILRALGI